MGVNQTISDRTIRHLLFLTRYQNKISRDVIREIRKMLPEILAALERANPDTVGAARLRMLEADIKEITGSINQRGGIKASVRAEMARLAVSEAEWQANLIAGQLPQAINFTTLSPRALERSAFGVPYEGMFFAEHLDDMGARAAKLITGAVRTGIVQSETMDQIARRIRGTAAMRGADGEFAKVIRYADTWARTTVMHTSNQVRSQFMADNADIIKGEQYVATLDTRTCPVCMGHDGKVFKPGDGPVPPVHFQCRCTRVAIVKSWRELGLTGLPESTRASMDGQVPESMTYGAWLKTQPKDVQDEALGVKRADLFRAGMNVDSFTNDAGKTWTLDQLRDREPDVFKRAKL